MIHWHQCFYSGYASFIAVFKTNDLFLLIKFSLCELYTSLLNNDSNSNKQMSATCNRHTLASNPSGLRRAIWSVFPQCVRVDLTLVCENRQAQMQVLFLPLTTSGTWAISPAKISPYVKFRQKYYIRGLWWHKYQHLHLLTLLGTQSSTELFTLVFMKHIMI